MKRIIFCMTAILMLMALMSACAQVEEEGGGKEERLKIVATIFPAYDWTREILGKHIDNTDLILLLDGGVDFHSYQPTAPDIIKISACDLFIYVGGESDAWIEKGLKEAVNKDMVVVNLLEVLGERVKKEEIIEGMAGGEHVHKDGEKAGVHDYDEENREYDEHVWLSLKNAEIIAEHIGSRLMEIDAENAEDYGENTDKYIEKLETLDKGYKETVDSAKQDTLLFGDRFPFRYLVDDYGISYYAAFDGCSAETEAGFETIVFLANKIDELGLRSVMTIEETRHKVAEAIIQNTKDKNQNIVSINSMQAITSKDIDNGVTYLSVMEKNLERLAEALT